MFKCERCKNTGKITEQYADFGPLGPAPALYDPAATDETLAATIKWRTVECPDCLGFGAAGWALPG